MLRLLPVLLLAVAPLGAAAEPPDRPSAPLSARAAEAILLGARRQAQRGGALVRQSGRGNLAVLSQSGTDSQGIIVQRGSGHSATLSQTGAGNAYAIVQIGRGAVSEVAQAGGEGGATVQVGR